MTIFVRLEEWEERGIISAEQRAVLAGLCRGEPLSVFLELNCLLYAGIVAFAAGLGWTISTWSRELGDVAVVTMLTAAFAGSLWYCFSRAPAWSRAEVPSPNLAFDYVLYLGSLIWSVELAYLENRFHLLPGQWDLYLLTTAGLFFFLAYRFDNRFVLALALSALAGWFGLTISHWPSNQNEAYRQCAIVYGAIIGGAGAVLRNRGLKSHFLGTYLNIAANVFFWALLSGVFDRENSAVWLLALLGACGASVAWGLARRQFSFVAYAAVYGYLGVSWVLLRETRFESALGYFAFTGAAMLAVLVLIARRFGREE